MAQELPTRPYFPMIQPKRDSLRTVFKLIRRKKTEFTQELEDIAEQSDSLPYISTVEAQNTQPEEEGSKESHLSRNNIINFSEIIDRNEEDRVKQESRVINTDRSLSNRRGNTSILVGLQGRKKSEQGRVQQKRPQPSHKMRIKTDFTELSRRNPQQRELQIEPHQQPSFHDFSANIDKIKQQFIQCLPKIPRSILEKNQSNLAQACACLEHFNPFFNRNKRIINVCLLKVGRILMRENELLYKAGQEANFFYIVLLGRVKLVNGGLKKICQAGETVLEQIVYSSSEVRVACERAKAVGVCVLLEITVSGLKRLKEELIKNGYKLAFQEIDVMIKRNHIVKNWLRNRVKMEENR